MVCAWCGTALADVPGSAYGEPVWYGMCEPCAGGPGRGLFPTQSLYEMTAGEYDALPFGLLELDRDGTVVKYNAAEEVLSGCRRDDVLGRKFFTEVAPCTRVQEFEGVLQEMLARGEDARHAFDFVFKFAGGDRFVHVVLCYEASRERALILVQVATADT